MWGGSLRLNVWKLPETGGGRAFDMPGGADHGGSWRISVIVAGGTVPGRFRDGVAFLRIAIFWTRSISYRPTKIHA